MDQREHKDSAGNDHATHEHHLESPGRDLLDSGFSPPLINTPSLQEASLRVKGLPANRMAAIHADLKLPSWPTEVGGLQFGDDFVDQQLLRRIRARESDAVIGPVFSLSMSQAHLDMSSLLTTFPSADSEQSGFGSSSQLDVISGHDAAVAGIPAQRLSRFEDVTTALQSFSSCEESLLDDLWDTGLSAPSEKRQRLSTSSPQQFQNYNYPILSTTSPRQFHNYNQRSSTISPQQLHNYIPRSSTSSAQELHSSAAQRLSTSSPQQLRNYDQRSLTSSPHQLQNYDQRSSTTSPQQLQNHDQRSSTSSPQQLQKYSQRSSSSPQQLQNCTAQRCTSTPRQFHSSNSLTGLISIKDSLPTNRGSQAHGTSRFATESGALNALNDILSSNFDPLQPIELPQLSSVLSPFELAEAPRATDPKENQKVFHHKRSFGLAGLQTKTVDSLNQKLFHGRKDLTGLHTKVGLEEGWPSHGLSPKGLNSLGGGNDINAMEKLLVHCAQALESKDLNLAHQIMWVLNNMVSADGDPNERVTASFLKALVRRAGRMAPSFNAMYGMERISKAVSALEYALMVDDTPWYRFGFKAANGAMLEAFEGKDRVHIIDFTTTYGMQWPTLIEALSGRAEGPPHVRLTVHNARPQVAPSLGMSQEDVIKRLIMFANTKSVDLEVRTVSHDIEHLEQSMFDIREDEITVVNCMYRARFIPDETASPPECPRDNFLKLLHSLNPDLVSLVDEEAMVTSTSLVTRLKAAFNYMWIPFDSLDTFLPRDRRVDYEVDLEKKIEDIVANEGLDRIERMETKAKWSQRMKRAGFSMVPFSEEVSEEVRVMLTEHAAGWGMKHDDDAMLLTWKGHNVMFATVWQPLSSRFSSSST